MDGEVDNQKSKQELKRIARRARSWIRLHPEETLRILAESGRLPSTLYYKEESIKEPDPTEDLDFYEDEEFY